MTFEGMAATWRSLLAEGGDRQRLVESHVLHLYYGSDTTSKAILILIADGKPPLPQLSRAVSVERGQRDDGRWSIVLRLEQQTYLGAFIGLCVELTRRASEGATGEAALRLFFETLGQWKRLMDWDANRLSHEAIRGLMGELSFLCNSLAPSTSIGKALGAWRGPYGAPQDFVLDTGALFEVKAVRADSRHIEISSVEQLDPDGLQPLFLVLQPVEDCAASFAGAVTLPGFIASTTAMLEQAGLSAELLDDRIQALALDQTDDYYADFSFRLGEPRFYSVEGEFPRILKASVPAVLDKVVYRLRTAALRDHEVTAAAVWAVLGSETADD